MNTQNIAIILSVFSICVAALSLGWNIYRDVILKPLLKVSIARVVVASGMAENSVKLMISGVNFGPGRVRLNIIRFMHSSILKRCFRKWKHGVLIHDYRNPISGQLPTTLDVGEKVDLLFAWDEENICSTNPSHIGISDSFGRTHWAPKKEIKKTMKSWKKDFKKT